MGGAVAWGIGEIPTLLVAIGVAVMWSRSDEREKRRVDRAADRNNDADLSAYNDMFARLAERDAKLASRTARATTTAPAERPTNDNSGHTDPNTKLEGR